MRPLTVHIIEGEKYFTLFFCLAFCSKCALKPYWAVFVAVSKQISIGSMINPHFCIVHYSPLLHLHSLIMFSTKDPRVRPDAIFNEFPLFWYSEEEFERIPFKASILFLYIILLRFFYIRLFFCKLLIKRSSYDVRKCNISSYRLNYPIDHLLR